jgi:hypothetical protein
MHSVIARALGGDLVGPPPYAYLHRDLILKSFKALGSFEAVEICDKLNM